MPLDPAPARRGREPLRHSLASSRASSGKCVNTAAGEVRWVTDPVDLRGLPAIGRNVAGAIRHAEPEGALLAKQPS
jgi:hypothetical protein